MADKTKPDFGKRRQVSVPPGKQPTPPPKRSNHVALLVMGTMAVGGTAYALMPRECTPAAPGATPGLSTPSECPPRSSSSGHSGSRYSYYWGGSSGQGPAVGTTDSGESGARRGGFGSFAHAIGAHGRGG